MKPLLIILFSLSLFSSPLVFANGSGTSTLLPTPPKTEKSNNPYLNEQIQRILKIIIVECPNGFSNTTGNELPVDTSMFFIDEPPIRYSTILAFPDAVETYVEEGSYFAIITASTDKAAITEDYHHLKELLGKTELPCGPLMSSDPRPDENGTSWSMLNTEYIPMYESDMFDGLHISLKTFEFPSMDADGNFVSVYKTSLLVYMEE